MARESSDERESLQKIRIITKLQAHIRGYLVRKTLQCKKEEIQKSSEEQRQNRSATIIQALFRGNKVRAAVCADQRVAEFRHRWQEGALRSNQKSLKKLNEKALEEILNKSDIGTMIPALHTLEFSTEVFPMMFKNNACFIVRILYLSMSRTNRSMSSIDMLKSAAALLVNLTRYHLTGPEVYARDRIRPILKFMWHYSNCETELFCILCTYLWLFSKYHEIKQDLTEFLAISENRKMMVAIKASVERTKRMVSNTRNNINTPQPHKFVSHAGCQSSMKYGKKKYSFLLPALEPDYGITHSNRPRYFEDSHQAISCLFVTYNIK